MVNVRIEWCTTHQSAKADPDRTCHEWQRNVLLKRAIKYPNLADFPKLKSDCEFTTVLLHEVS